ncbi:MAG: hypothetical protein E2P08_01270 [Acidobacteria bacterium]|nr:MAG: hypothetical protein E2P08_01270 [Acidobacteriota bacterium]TDI12269.1 MAG: hypothetical protein E2P07_03790 [Acidobacteriota bacterium]
MPTIFLQHRVADYESWRPAYDEDVERRSAAGLSEIGVFRKTGDENLVLLVWGAENVESFQAMLNSEDLKHKMQEAGVVSEPEIWIGEGL